MTLMFRNVFRHCLDPDQPGPIMIPHPSYHSTHVQCSECPIRHRAVCARCDSAELRDLDSLKYYRTIPAADAWRQVRARVATPDARFATATGIARWIHNPAPELTYIFSASTLYCP